jgi:ribosomal-protein-alanine N-acetyltransferase
MNPVPARIRPMTPADLDRVMEIAGSLKDAPHWPLAVYQAALHPQSVPRRIALVAEDAVTGGLVGFAVASVVGAQAELESIAVAAEGQRRGMGAGLLAVLVEELKRSQVDELLLEVRASNGQALEFYRRRGFSQSGRRPRYYADPVEDALLLALPLDKQL